MLFDGSCQTEISIDVGSAYSRGRGGPGGWWIIVEPEIHFITDVEVALDLSNLWG